MTKMLCTAIAAFGLFVAAVTSGVTAAEEPTTPATRSSEGANLFVFIYRPGPAWRAGVPMKQQGLGPHGAYMQSLLDGGHLFAAGGFSDDDGGMAIITAADLDEARKLLSADPAVSSGIFVGDVEAWRPRFRAGGALPTAQ
jgi:uncharacterized protein